MRIGEKLKTEDALMRAAESLLEQGGPDAVTTRAVCDAANVGAPTLYHHYGDKNGLLDALVTGLEEHVGDRGCDDILLLLVTMRLSADA